MLLNVNGRYTINEGDIFKDPIQGLYKILKIDGEKVYIQFLDEYNHEQCVYFNNLYNQVLHNPYLKNIFDIACLGNIKHGYSITKEFITWNSIIIKCYNKESKDYINYGAKGVKVANRWLCYENFLNDIPYLKNYSEWKNDHNNIYYLDKDIYSNRICKLYSNKTCLFSRNDIIKKIMCNKIYG